MQDKQYGITIHYTEPGGMCTYTQYREYVSLGNAARNFVRKITNHNFFTVKRVIIMDRKARVVTDPIINQLVSSNQEITGS